MTSSIPTISIAPAPLWRRAYDGWLEQVKHVLPPTIFFFGFDLVMFTHWATLQEQGSSSPNSVGRVLW